MSGECKVDKVRPDYLDNALKNARTLEDVFSSLHILQNGDTVLTPPNRIDPQDSDLAGKYRDINADRWPYLAASRGGYNVTKLFSNGVNSEALNCALNALNYNEGQGKAVAEKVGSLREANESESSVQSYLGGLSAVDQRNYEIYNTIRFMHQFDKGDGSLDKDGDFSVISRDDLVNWANDLDDGQVQGEKAVVRMHVILGLVNYFENPPPQALIPNPVTKDAAKSEVGKAFDLPAPEGGWKAGDSVTVDGKTVAGLNVATTGTAALSIPAASLPLGEHKVELKRADGGVITTPVSVVEAAKDDPNLNKLPATDDKKALTGEDQNGGDKSSDSSWVTHYLLPGLGLIGFGALGSWLITRNRGNGPTGGNGGTPPTGGNDNAPRRRNHPDADAAIQKEQIDDSGIPSPKNKTVSAKTATPPPLPKKSAPAPKEADDMDDVLKDLEKAKGSQTPTSGPSPSQPSINSVTGDNVIISGANAEPVPGVSENVIRSQIVLQYRRFMSEGAREALFKGEDLPTNPDDLISSRFRREVDELVDRVVAAYHKLDGSEEGKAALKDLWENQRSERGFIVRRGVPQNLLREVVGEYIKEHTKSASSPFAGGVGAEMRSEAERHSGETEFFERGMREILKSSGR